MTLSLPNADLNPKQPTYGPIRRDALGHSIVDLTEEGRAALADAIREHTQSGLDISFVRDANVVLIGDSNHDNLHVQQGIRSLLPQLKQLGFTAVAFECPIDYSLEDRSTFQSSYIPHAFAQKVACARDLGFALFPVDLPSDQFGSFASFPDRCRARGQHMGAAVADLVEQGHRVALVVGLGHLEAERDVPSVLKARGHAYQAVAVFSRFQGAAMLGRSSSPFSEGVVEMFQSFHPELIEATVRLPTSFAIHAFVVAKRVRAGEGGESIEPSPSLADGTLAIAHTTGSLLPSRLALAAIDGGKRLTVDFSTSVEPDCARWEKSNERKIVAFCQEMISRGNLSAGESLLLTLALQAYAHRNGDHSLGGSIRGMEYLPSDRVVRLTVVDCLHYPFDPTVEYGALEKTVEVAFPTLDERSGVGALVEHFVASGGADRLRGLDLPGLVANPDDPSTLKFVPLILAALTAPELVECDPVKRCIIVHGPSPEGHVTTVSTLKLSDFRLSPPEQKLLELDDLADSCNEIARQLRMLRFDENKNAETPQARLQPSFLDRCRSAVNVVFSWFDRKVSSPAGQGNRDVFDAINEPESKLFSFGWNPGGLDGPGVISAVLGSKARLSFLSSEEVGAVASKVLENSAVIADFVNCYRECLARVSRSMSAETRGKFEILLDSLLRKREEIASSCIALGARVGAFQSMDRSPDSQP